MKVWYPSLIRVCLLVETVLVVCCYLCNPAGYAERECTRQERLLYAQRKKFLERLVSDVQCEIDLWKSTRLQKESFAREQLNMARSDEIIYYYAQRDTSSG